MYWVHDPCPLHQYGYAVSPLCFTNTNVYIRRIFFEFYILGWFHEDWREKILRSHERWISFCQSVGLLRCGFVFSFLETHSYSYSPPTLCTYCTITVVVALQVLKPIYRRLQTNCHRYEEYFHYCGNVSKFMSILRLSSFMTYIYKVCSLHHVILLSQSFRSVSLVLHQSLPGSKALRA